MKIYYLSPARLPSHRANTVQITRMCNEFSKQGHSVCLFGVKEPERNESVHEWYGLSEKVEISLHPWSQKRQINSIFYARAIFKDLQARKAPDLFYSRHLLSLYFARNFGVPMVYEAHMPPRDWPESFLQKQLFRSPNFVRLVTVSHVLKEYYEQAFPFLNSAKIVVAPNGADDPELEIDLPAVELPGKPERLRLGYIGSLHPWKGALTIVEIAKRMPEVNVYVVGCEQEELERMFDLDGNTNLHALGYVAPREVRRFVSSFDMMLAPYRHLEVTSPNVVRRDDTVWGSPLKIFEYLSAGACILASDIPIVRELLISEECAILCDANDIDQWILSLERLRNDANLREDLKKGARKRFLENYRRSNRVHRVLDGLNGGPS